MFRILNSSLLIDEVNNTQVLECEVRFSQHGRAEVFMAGQESSAAVRSARRTYSGLSVIEDESLVSG